MKKVMQKLLSFALVLLTVFSVLTPILPSFTAKAVTSKDYVEGFPLPITEKKKVYKVTVLGKYSIKINGSKNHRSSILYDIYPKVKNKTEEEKEYIAKQKKYCEFVMDISASNGTNIYAVADGTVIVNRKIPSYNGYELVIKHFDGSYSYYGHIQKKSPFKINEKIYSGDLIGIVGSGHLHFEWSKHDPFCMYKSVGLVKIASGSGAAVSPHTHDGSGDNLWAVPIEPAIEMKTVKNDVPVRKGPSSYNAINKAFGNKGYLPKNTIVTVVASYVNEYNNLWYKTSEGYWIYSERVAKLSKINVSYKPSKSTNTKNSKENIKLPESDVFVKGQSYTIPAKTPVRKGYKFMGWALKNNASKAQFQAGEILSKNKITEILNGKTEIVFYPVWKKTETNMSLSKYNVNLDLSDNSKKTKVVSAWCTGDLANINKKMTCVSDNNAVAIAEIISQRYSNFLFWDEIVNDIKITAKTPGKANIKIELYNESGTLLISKSITVNVSQSYTISYYTDTNGGVAKTQTKKYNKNIELLDYIPEKKGYTFLGWTRTAGSSVSEYGPGDLFKSNNNTSLYPVWNKKYQIEHSFKDGVLTISGFGGMASYPTGKTPWASYASDITEIKIELGVTSIGMNAFSGLSNLKKVTLPTGVVKIGAKAFYNCKKLQTIAIPSSVVSIGNRAFANCSSLKGVSLPKEATRSAIETSIGAFAFENCVSLSSVEFPDTVTEIGNGAFTGCSVMNTFEIPAGVEVINDSTFFGCSSLEEINIPSGVTKIGDSAFNGCSAAEEIIIPDTVSVIGDQAFSGCSVITEIDIPESVDTIGAGVFTNCSALTDVDLPNDMEYIGEGMFSGCSALETVEIPETVSYIGDGAFGYCSSLTGIDIPEKVAEINDSTFYGCSSLESFEIPSNIISIGDYAFGDCKNLKDVMINEGTASIGVGAFAFCDSLETVSAPASLSVIEDGAFMECASLTSIDLLESELTIGEDAFLGCSSLTDIQLPEGIVSIGEGAFDGCSADFAPTCFSTSSVFGQLSSTYDNLDVIYPVSGVTLDKSEVNLLVGQTLNLNATVAPYNATCKDIIWCSNNPDYVSVDENGKVTALDGGRATITATTKDNAFVASCVINSIVPVEGISLSFNEFEAYIDEEFSINYTFAPENPTDIGVTWSSSNENIATVSEDGKLNILSEGQVTLTVTTNDGGFTDSCVINTKEYIAATGITIDESLELTVGESKQLQVQIIPSNVSSKDVFWNIDDTEIVEIQEDGTLIAKKEGTTKIYAYATSEEDAPYAECTVTVKSNEPEYNYVFSIQTPSTTTIRHKDGIKLHTSIDGTVPAGSYVKWTSSNSNFKTEEINNGNSLQIVSDKNGYTTFTATLYSENGEVLATESIEMRSKAGFFDKLGSFFRSLFGGTKIHEN
jgi:uncharacterized protein YjdB